MAGTIATGSITELIGFKLETPVKSHGKEITVETYVLFNERQNKKIWMELYLGIQGDEIKDTIIGREIEASIHDRDRLKQLAQDYTQKHAEIVANEVMEATAKSKDVVEIIGFFE